MGCNHSKTLLNQKKEDYNDIQDVRNFIIWTTDRIQSRILDKDRTIINHLLSIKDTMTRHEIDLYKQYYEKYGQE